MSEEHLVRTKAILAAQEGKYRRSAMRWKVGYRFLPFSGLVVHARRHGSSDDDFAGGLGF